ncbi:outer membrane beta-barrel protein [Hydrogenophaga sp.]|uniref:outer membrane beta-barrel protein n=1 Tax=Hydrogenophaga sp. TaxID=1904254 RepID=UPI003F6E4C2F
MNRSISSFKTWPLAAVAMAVACSVSAQTQAPGNDGSTTVLAQAAGGSTSGAVRTTGPRMPGEGGYSIIPYSTQGYVGLNVGRPDYDLGCGAGGFSCSDSSTSFNLYTGGMFTQYLGAEFGYVNLGKMRRGGGSTKAHGLNVSLVGRVPLGAFNVFGKLGTTYSRTEVSASALSGIATGRESGWAPTYGAGVGFDLTPRSSIVLEWNRYDMRFAGVGKQEVTTTSLGYVHRF